MMLRQATLDQDRADHLAGIALGHVERRYPHGLSHVFLAPEDATPAVLHPVFFGSFDWHSCVHAYWLLATLRRRFPAMPCAGAIATLFDARLTAPAIAGECAYFARSSARGFERPYGWAWVLALQHALRDTAWERTARPLAQVIAARMHAFLPGSRYPVRVGTHFNTAFALVVSAPYAAANDPALLALLREKALNWYGEDADCQAWEPSQDDFLSSALIEAVCMQRLHPEGFPAWMRRFLPRLALRQPATLFEPAQVGDRSDGKIAHLDGLNLSRAWCWRLLAASLESAAASVASAASVDHLAAGLAHVEGDFMGEHWLASFALLALWPDALDGATSR